ncbi:hypothetical protein Ocin01_12803 [Orchesella cincta]|uniref:Uncharacterized protein n=1 Tax=Orchesella cincta TaxID=48709 RepID=A0A1D2MM04_ORCCI|nr:hypothetical protein Ocin01_12803 [Orchesella cincta]
MCCFFSQRTFTYFLSFTHLFFAVVFLSVVGMEAIIFYKSEPLYGWSSDISTSLINDSLDLYIVSGYGFLYLVSALIIFHGIHKEFVSVIKWMTVIFFILQCCSVGMLKHMLERHPDTKGSSFHDALETMFSSSLTVFFIIVQLFHSMIYLIDLVLYACLVSRSKLVVHKIVYV